MSAFASWPSKTFNASTSDISGLVLGKAAYIYPAPAGVDTISAVIRSESQRIVDAFAFTPVTTSSGVKALDVDLKQTWANAFWFWSGDYLLDIYVPATALQYLKLDGCGDVVVNPGTLGTKTVDVKLDGSGSVFVQDAALAMDRFNLDVSGSGRIQVDVASITSALDATISGSGDIVVSTTTLAGPTVRASVSGSGDIYVVATKALNASSVLTSSISGSGRITLADAGTCGQHDAKVSGSGTIQAGAIACATTRATLSGSGSLYVSATESISVDKSGSGSVVVVGRAPGRVTGAIEVSASNPVTRIALEAVPAHTASHFVDIGSGFNVVLSTVLIIVVIIVVKKVRRSYRQRRERRMQQEQGDATPYGASMTPVVIVEVVPEAHAAKGHQVPSAKLV